MSGEHQRHDPRYDNYINAYPTTASGKNGNSFSLNNQTVPTPYPINDVTDSTQGIDKRPYFTSATPVSFSTTIGSNRAVAEQYVSPFQYSSPQQITDNNNRSANSLLHSQQSRENVMHSSGSQNFNSSVSSLASSNATVVTAAEIVTGPEPSQHSNHPYDQGNVSSNLQQNIPRGNVSHTYGERPPSGQKRSSNSTIPQEKNLSNYSYEAIRFYEIYKETVEDSTNFTPTIQLKWCETLFEYAFKDDYICEYNINAEKLRRQLTPDEMKKNQNVLIEHSFKVLSKLITKKYPAAMYLMGTLYSHQPYLKLSNKNIISRDDKKAFELYCIGAKFNHSDSCYRAGISFEYSRGVTVDPENGATREYMIQKALEYYERGASVCDNALCKYKLGMCYLYGFNDNVKLDGSSIVEPDIKLAISWFEKSSNSQSIYELAKIYEFDGLSAPIKQLLKLNDIHKDNTKAISYYYKSASEFNNALSQWKIGYCYETGELNLPVDGKKSIAYYMKSAHNNNNAMAMLSISGWYLTGCLNVLEANEEESFRWVFKSCKISEGKFSKAEYILGYYFENGIGCEANVGQAKLAYERAARLGYTKAVDRLRQM